MNGRQLELGNGYLIYRNNLLSAFTINNKDMHCQVTVLFRNNIAHEPYCSHLCIISGGRLLKLYSLKRRYIL